MVERMRRSLLTLFALLALAGVVIAAWASLWDARVMAAVGGVFGSLQSHGQAENIALRDDLYAIVLRLQQPLAVVQWLGMTVAVLGGVGFAKVWRGDR